MGARVILPVPLGILGFVSIALVLASPALGVMGARRVVSMDAELSMHLKAVDAAIAEHDVSEAVRTLAEAYRAALASRHWQGMVAYGDAALRLAGLSPVRRPGIEQARRAYLIALYRARGERSLDGALVVAQSFAALGDREIATACLVMAERLARTDAERARVREMAARVNERLLMAEISAF
jgi:hypothetical protein